MNEKSNTWFQVVFEDRDGLSGSSVEKFIGDIMDSFAVSYGVVRDVVPASAFPGGGENVWISMPDLMKAIGLPRQYDWAFFFLFDQRISLDLDGMSDMDLLKVSPTTVRLVDSQYIYVFSKNSRVCDFLSSSYQGVEIKSVDFENLEVPY